MGILRFGIIEANIKEPEIQYLANGLKGQFREGKITMRDKENSDFCCKELKQFCESDDVGIVYLPKFRVFGIDYNDGSQSMQRISHCPWSGHNLPEGLRDAWFDELEKLGFDPEDWLDENVPEEFKSDKWWKVRNL